MAGSADPIAGLAGLHPGVFTAIRRRGIVEPTEIQRLAAEALRGGSDALLISPTGTGKTEAVLWPLLSERLREPSPPVSLLYITPLRSLNRDLAERLVALCAELGLRAGVRHGDTPTGERLRQSRHPPDVLLTTPETLQLLLVGSRLRQGLRELRTVVIDEVHELAPSDRGGQLALTLERLDAFVGRPVRRIGLSATVGNPEQVARFLSPAPRSVQVRVAHTVRSIDLVARVANTQLPPLDPATIADLRAEPTLLSAVRTVDEELRGHRASLVFVNTRPTAEGLAARLKRLSPDLAVAVHHGSLSREAREAAEAEFRSGALRGLVATSSLELGIDIGLVDHVVQFGSPHQASRLLQRAGRSGHRLDRAIHGVVLALDVEDLEEAAVLARRASEGEVEEVRWRRRNRLALAQQIIAAVRADGAQESAPLLARLRAAEPARELTDAEVAELVRYLTELRSVGQEAGRLRPGRGTLDRFYRTLSLIPEERTYRLRDIGSRRLLGTLDERFVLTQVLGEPDQIFLLHGRAWRVVETREDELLVEGVNEIGQEPRWVGEDLPVPFDVAQEIGRLRREGPSERYPLTPQARATLAERYANAPAQWRPDDRRMTVTIDGRTVVLGACLGDRTNATLALVLSGLLTQRLGGRVDVLSSEATWIVLGLPVAIDAETLRATFAIEPGALRPLADRLVPASPEYRWVFLTVARKFGVIPPAADPRDRRVLEPLIERAGDTPLGQEALEKTLHDRFDLPHAEEVFRRLQAGTIELRIAPTSTWTDGPLSRLRWRELPDRPPPTLLRAVESRLRDERLTLVCLRCGFTRETTPARFRTEGGSNCRLCHGALSAVISSRRPEELRLLVRYAKAKRQGRRPGRRGSERLPELVRQGYTTAELLAHHGDRALLALAARGVGPESARRLLARPYRNDAEFLTEILRAERQYARTRAFWD